jgi:Holliday junction resolvasome RuvABC ATP-dependent DNA helicase subunit
MMTSSIRTSQKTRLIEWKWTSFGLDELDRKFLMTIIEKFDGGPSAWERSAQHFMKKKIPSRK